MSANKVILLICLLAAYTSAKEIMVIEYCRHGARGSLADLHNGSRWIKDWGVEQLTGNGMRMQFHLGKEMKYRYPNVFDETFNVNHMDSFATNFNRTISSGLSQFTGIFDMFKGPQLPFPNNDKRLQPPVLTIDPEVGFNTALPKGYTPIPITSKLNQRKMQIIRDDCPYGNMRALDAKKKLGDYIMKQPKVIDLVKRGAAKYGITDITDINFKATGQRVVDIDTLFYLGDFTIQDYLHNKHPTIPMDDTDGSKNPLFTQLEAAYSLATLARFNDSEFTRNIISDVLYEIKHVLTQKANGKTSKRFVLYSGHDDMLSAILQEIGYLDPQCLIEQVVSGDSSRMCTNTPGLAASMVWELHQEGSDSAKQFFIKVRYNTKFVDFCGLTNEADDFRCTFEQFASRLELIANKDYKDWCLGGDDRRRSEAVELEWKIITWILVGVLFLFIIGFGSTAYYLHKKTSTFEREQLNQIDGDAYMSMAQRDSAN